VQGLEQWASSVLANLSSLVRGPSANLSFDAVQSRDPFQCFPGQRRSVGLFQVIELTPHVRPASHLLNPVIFIELIEPGIGIRL
jgi:hypothetical protein